MTVGDLKQLMKGVKDDVLVLVPVPTKDDFEYFSPCYAESGLDKFGLNNEDEEPAFLLVPHGFFEEADEHEIDTTLN